jgi:polyhydroxyalkanoate synthase
MSFSLPRLAKLNGVARHALSTVLRGSPPPGLGATPRELVFHRDKLELFRVRPSKNTAVSAVPLLVVPPLMVRPYIYDLQPEHSLLAQLRDAGFDVFLLDFGVPDAGDAEVRLDDYVLDYVPTCIEQTLAHSGASQVVVVGYCMGGLFGLIHVGTHEDPRVAALVTIGSPVNFRRLGPITIGARLAAPLMDPVVTLVGNVPGELSSLVFKLLSGPRILRSYVDLLRRLDDEEHRRSFLAINFWINDMIPYPREAFRQLYSEIIVGNKLRKGTLSFRGKKCDLGRVTCPVLSFAGEQDIIAPPDSIREIIRLVGAADRRLITAPGGHVGVVAGHHAPERVWQPMMEWLGERCY